MKAKIKKALLVIALGIVLVASPKAICQAEEVEMAEGERAMLYLTETHYSPSGRVSVKVELAIQDSTSQISSCVVIGVNGVSGTSGISAGSVKYTADRKGVSVPVVYYYNGVLKNETITIR